MPKGYNVFSTLNPQQQTILSQLLGSMQGQARGIGQQPTFQSGQNYIQRILGGDTSQFEAPLMRQFQEQIVPQLAERFSGAGAGAQSSSAFQQALGGAGADLAERLGSLRGQLQLGALPQALSYAQAPGSELLNLLGLNTQAFAPKQKPWWQGALTGLAGGIGSGIGSGLTGGIGAGSSLLSGLSSLIKKNRNIDPDIQALIDYLG
jgi:hypothetical protein